MPEEKGFKTHNGGRYKPHRKLNPLPPMVPVLNINIKTGNVLWDSLAEDVGHVYDHACYNEELERMRKQGEQLNMTIIGSPFEKTIEFDSETYCESCFQQGRGEQELRVKNGIYCPCCGIRRPIR